jgi:hypothetical protein
MTTLEQLPASEVRRLAMEALEQLGRGARNELSETILLRDGNYVGRRFDANNGLAIWLIDDERLTIYDCNDREVLRLSVVPPSEPLRRAA